MNPAVKSTASTANVIGKPTVDEHSGERGADGELQPEADAVERGGETRSADMRRGITALRAAGRDEMLRPR